MPNSERRLSRRGLLGLLGAGTAGLAVGGAGGAALAQAAASGALGAGAAGTGDRVIPFHGEHQAGIVTPAQDRLHFASFELLRGVDRERLIGLLRDWTDAAVRLTRGEDVSAEGAVGGPPLAPPDDTGEALGLGASGLTITFGFGASLFADEEGRDRFGIADRRPAEFEELPAFAFDLLDPGTTGGDLCVQACADDPQVAVHAIRNLSRIAMGTARILWSQLGFGRTSSTSVNQDTPRNLFGFKDGTANVMAEERDALAEYVWAPADHPQAWMRGGSYLVARKIAMTIETWDRASLAEQERIVGRTKGEGGPLSGGAEFDAPDFSASSTAGGPAIAADAHVRLAHPEQNGGLRMLRRGYNYVDGSNPLGQLGAGLFFMSYQRTPETFVRVQRNLKSDSMNEYLRHVGSGLWAIPGGIRPGEYVGEALFTETA
ncbi:iron uptake transporter deferrochelatase/peroxidase subunit [Leucobacter sp. PH1c]|uniref:iron uptake transporter deferrochelatase/peroxidase subunit n=1 Tax=Leucobacter sp. PH1c TaxID=1397278 RepID=UPI00046902AC|nr:iron uptake transporter deferrochelatase/peroxidase subunit [Leucobacter sp. PH1c]